MTRTPETRAETGLFLDGVRCAGCVNRIERALRSAPGVRDAAVNYTTHRALVRFDPEVTSAAAIGDRVAELGYGATPYDPGAVDRPAERGAREALARVLVAAFLAGNVMLVSLALYLGGPEGLEPGLRRGLRWLAIALSVPAVAWCGLPFFRGAAAGLRRLEITMDVPIALGIATAFGVSVAGTFRDAPQLYMDSAAMIVFLILLGRTLERGARGRAAGAVARLAAAAPPTALLCAPEGVREVASESLRPGDRVVVPAGQTVPADGRVAKGETELDESILTGESRPVARRAGEPVSGGTRNLSAEVEVEVTAPVREGTVARLVALLERAQAERPPVQRLADRVAAVFAPAVVGLALLTAGGWALLGAAPMDVALRAAAVLIVACPCALGLATPAAVTAAVGRAARLGILVKSGEALERCARVDAALLDKTGTVSEGRFAVLEVEAAADVGADDLLAAAAAAEGADRHPVARAVREAAAARGLEPPAAEPRRTLPGRGVVAGAAAEALRVGSRAFLAEAGVAVPPALDEAGRKLAERGLTLAWVARGDRALGVLGLADPPRPDAADAVARLAALGVPVELVSGDHEGAVALAARRAGIAAFAGGVSPEAKVERVRDRRARGAQLLVAGDGINDAAALSAADVGVAMARGADVTLHAADVVVAAPRLAALAELVALSRTTLRRIRQNLAFALLYNAAAIPLAVAGFLPPLHAAVAMSLSSLVVTGNAVRLLRWRPGA